jgi:hypothetical protein
MPDDTRGPGAFDQALAADREDPMLQFFTYGHLPDPLKHASAPFCDLAHQVCRMFRRNPERTVCLRKLLEAKDCAVRALLYQS